MSEGMIIRRGGGASLKATDALLRVQAPAGSTVTITKGTTTKTDLGHENALDPSVYDYYFIIHQSQFDSVNPWTVTATLNGKTATDTVIIDAADEYDVVLIYQLVIYDNGQTDYTFGSSKSSSVGSASITEGADNITFAYRYADTTGSGYGYFYTNETFDITPYTTMRVYALISQRGTVGVGTTTTTMDASVTGTGNTQEYVVDVSQLTGQHMFRVNMNSASSTAYSAKIYSIVLE